MTPFSLSELSDQTLLQDLAALVAKDRATTAALLVHLGECDERRLYRRAAYSSMAQYCIGELRMSEDTAYRRIDVARMVRKFPAIFPAVADGRLNMTTVLLLAPHLTPGTADGLLAAAALKTKEEIRLLLAERFPQPDVPTLIQAIGSPVAGNELAAQSVELRPAEVQMPHPTAEHAAPSVGPNPPIQQGPLAPERAVPSVCLNWAQCVEPLAPRARVAPLSPGRFSLQITLNQETHDLLRYAQALLGHTLPSGDVAGVIERALRELVDRLEKRKFAKSARSRPDMSSREVPRNEASGRYVPAEVRRAVWQRDAGRCTFVSSTGKRCGSDTRLEIDHVHPVASGGATTVHNLRLCCRAHNQYAAECAFGREFMRGKRQEARRSGAHPDHAPKPARSQEGIPLQSAPLD